MTNLPPPDPRSSQRTPLGFDEVIGIFVAFTTIGGILFWAFSHKNEGFNVTSILSPSPSPTAPTASPSPGATNSPAPVSPVPTVEPTESPQVLTPVPSPTIRPAIPTIIPPLPITTPAPVARSPVPAPVPAPAPAQPLKFVDVPNNYWARPFIDGLSQRRIVNGFPAEYFRPNQPVTRAEFAALLQQAFKQNLGQGTTGYKDVPSDLWAVPGIDAATRNGFLKGYPGNVFRPQQLIPRAQIFVALASGLNLPTASSPAKDLQYQDAAKIPKYATDKIAAATEASLVVNYPNQNLLNPNQNATRAEVAAIVYQALVRAGKVPAIQSPYIVGQK